MEREHVVCNNCGSEKSEPVGGGIDFEYGTSSEEFEVVRCSECGLIYLQDRPSASEFKTIYPRGYYSYSLVENELKNPSNKNSPAAKSRKKIYQTNFKAVLSLLPDYDSREVVRILDIGCGDGRLLNWFKEMNPEKHETYGIDNDENAKAVVEGEGHTFFFGLFEELDLSQYSFDIVTSNHVMEHVPDPKEFCRKALSVLRPGGVFTFDTPNVDSWDRRLTGKRYWGGYHFPRHWVFYSEKSAREMLRQVGMEAVSVSYYPNAVFHNWTVHHFLSERPLLKFLAPLFPPVGIFHNSLHSFALLAGFTVMDIVGQKLFGGKPANMKVIARPVSEEEKRQDSHEPPGIGKESVRTAEKTFSRFMSSFRFNTKYIFNIRKPIMVYRVGHNLILSNVLRKAYPRTLDLNITNDCNLKCEHCFAESFLTKKGEAEPLAPKDYRHIAAQAIRMGFTTFTITGGEPFISDRIFEIIRSIYPQKVWIACATNGTLCTRERLVEARRSGLDCVYVSVDSLRPEAHDRFRGNKEGTLEKALAAIDTARAVGLKVAINTTITRQGIYEKDFMDLVEYTKARGLLLLLNLAAPAGKWTDREELYFRYEDTSELLKIQRKNPHVRTDMEANYLEWGCPSFKERLYITSFGDVLPCPFIHISWGNAREEPLDKIIARGRANPHFSTYQPLCLASQDREFIKKYIYRTFDHDVLPVPQAEIFDSSED